MSTRVVRGLTMANRVVGSPSRTVGTTQEYPPPGRSSDHAW